MQFYLHRDYYLQLINFICKPILEQDIEVA